MRINYLTREIARDLHLRLLARTSVIRCRGDNAPCSNDPLSERRGCQTCAAADESTKQMGQASFISCGRSNHMVRCHRDVAIGQSRYARSSQEKRGGETCQ